MPKYGGPNGYGHIPNPDFVHVDPFRKLSESIKSDGSAPTIDLSSFAMPVADQGSTSSCPGHAVAGAVYTTCAAQGHQLPYVPSPKGIYTDARCIDRTPSPELGWALPPLTDEGAFPDQAVRAIAEWGVMPIQAPTTDGRYSDCDPVTINDEPTLNDLEAESALVLTGAYGIDIDVIGKQRVMDLRKSLSNGYAVCFSTYVGIEFENWTPSKGPLKGVNGTPNHYVYLISYRTLPDGTTVFKFRNSWGPGWGIYGDGLGDESFVAKMHDIYIMQVAATEHNLRAIARVDA